MKKKIVLILAGIGLAALAGLCLIKMLGREEEIAEDSITAVETVRPETATIELYTSLMGTIEPEQVARVYSEAAGTVTEVYVKAGEEVEVGQLICTVDTKLVESAKNTMDNASITYRETKTLLERMETLYHAGGISLQEYEGYVNDAQKAEISYRQAQEDYEKQVSHSNITSPLNGKVEKCDIEALDRVTAGQQLFVVSGEGDRLVSTSLTEDLHRHVKIGDPVLAEKLGTDYTGTIVEISEMTDEETGLYETKVRLENTEGLSTGTTVKLSVCSNRAEQALTVPVDAVYYENSLPYVFTYDNGIVHKVFIEAGIYDSERREVMSGLEMDMEIIVTWSPELYEGARVVKTEAEAGGTLVEPAGGEGQNGGDNT